MALHLAAWIVLLFFSVNTAVLEYVTYDTPLKYLSFGPYHKPQPSAAVIAAAASASGPGAAAAAVAAAEAVETGFRHKRGVASSLTDPEDFDVLSPALSWWYAWGGTVRRSRNSGVFEAPARSTSCRAACADCNCCGCSAHTSPSFAKMTAAAVPTICELRR